MIQILQSICRIDSFDLKQKSFEMFGINKVSFRLLYDRHFNKNDNISC